MTLQAAKLFGGGGTKEVVEVVDVARVVAAESKRFEDLMEDGDVAGDSERPLLPLRRRRLPRRSHRRLPHRVCRQPQLHVR